MVLEDDIAGFDVNFVDILEELVLVRVVVIHDLGLLVYYGNQQFEDVELVH